MRRLAPLLVPAALVLGLASACARVQPEPPPAAADAAPAPAAADRVLVARYAGTLPCADCAGVLTELALYRAGSPHGAPAGYELRETYQATAAGDRTVTSSGPWLILRGTPTDRDATVYQLVPGRPGLERNFARIGEDELRQLDHEQREIRTAQNYTLTRVEPATGPGPAKVTTLSAEDDGRSVVLAVQDELVVQLRSNRTTGYRWSLAETKDDALALEGAPSYVQDPAPRGALGVGGTETWRFTAVRPGPHTLRFTYRRPWDTEAGVARAVRYSVMVR